MIHVRGACGRQRIGGVRVCNQSLCATTAIRAQADWHAAAQHSSGNGSVAVEPPTLMPGIVQIFGGKSKQPLCLGTLVHARIVMTTLVCATM